MAELIIRAGHSDHTVVADLLAPGGAIALHRPIDRLVANAQTAAARLGTGERADVRAMIARRGPRPAGQARGGGGQTMVYLEPLGRSVPRPIAETLLGDRGMRARLMCDDERCCPDGISSLLDDPRPHAVRSRARRLAQLDQMPHRSWRLHQVAKDARVAASLARRSSLVLRSAGLNIRLEPAARHALARVGEFLRKLDEQQLSA